MLTFATRPRLFPLLAALLVCHLAIPAPAADDASIARMRKDINFLAGPECEGRGVETQGINKAADYIAATFKEIGLKPASPDGSYFQPFSIAGQPKLSSPNRLVLAGPQGQQIEPKLDKQFAVSGLSGKAKASAGLVFVGYGITAGQVKYDDYKDVDAAGKIVVVLRKTPRFNAKQKEAPFAPDVNLYAALVSKIANAEQHKAAGVLFVNDGDEGRKGDNLMPFGYAAGASGGEGLPVLHIRRSLLEQMLASQGLNLGEIETDIDRDLKPRSVALKGWTASVETNVLRTTLPAKNVVGVLEGKGPLAKETVVIGAHYDHLGRGERGSLARGSTDIHFGADDNGSGTTAVLELARRFAAQKDRQGRRIVFMLFSGEERGLLGSAHYAKEPLLPLDSTVAMINLDMVGRLQIDKSTKKEKLEIGGVGSAQGFEKLIDKLNEKYGFEVKKTRSGVGPSDHTSFYRKKVPVFFFFTGMHPEYHRPTDTPDRINFPGMKKIVDMVEELATQLATEAKRPEYVAGAGPSGPTGTPGGVPRIGFMPAEYNDDEARGVPVGGVSPNGPAAKAGIKEGDWIVEIAGEPVKNMTTYMSAMGKHKRGEPLEIVVKRGDKKVKLKVTPQ